MYILLRDKYSKYYVNIQMGYQQMQMQKHWPPMKTNSVFKSGWKQMYNFVPILDYF